MCETKTAQGWHGWKLTGVMAWVLMLVVSCSGGDNPENATWLHGGWELSHNPENDDRDTLIFYSNGTVTIHAQHNRIIVGTYEIRGNTLALALAVANRRVDVSFEISSDQSRLIYRSGAYYTRQQAMEQPA